MDAGVQMMLGVPLDPNCLTVSDWEKLPGVGPVTAKNIIDHRQNNGGFIAVSDLKSVPGLGDVRVKQIEQTLKYGLLY